MFAGFCRNLVESSVLFLSDAAMQRDVPRRLGLTRPCLAVNNTRRIGKKDMVHNNLMPKMEVDPETYEVRANGELLTCEPAKVLPLAQRYFLF
jgi:urease subunit alpha